MVPRQVEELCSHATHLAHSANQICSCWASCAGGHQSQLSPITANQQRANNESHGMDEHQGTSNAHAEVLVFSESHAQASEWPGRALA